MPLIAFSNLFWTIKQIKIHSRPNPFVSTEIKGLMNTSDMWHKRAMNINDKLHWNAYRHFRQEVKREIRLAEKEYSLWILKSNGNTKSSWKILNRYIPRKNTPLATVENPLLLANKFNEFYANLSTMTALKATTELAEEYNFNIHDTLRDLIRANLIATAVQTILSYLHFNPLPQAMCVGLLRVYLQIKLLVVIKLTPKSWKTAHQLSLPL